MLYEVLRITKLLAVLALCAGTVGAFLPRDLSDRRRAAYVLAGPAFGLTWSIGFLLSSLGSHSLLSTWAIGGMASSLVSLQVVLFAVGKDGRRRPGPAALAVLTFALTVVLMSARPA